MSPENLESERPNPSSTWAVTCAAVRSIGASVPGAATIAALWSEYETKTRLQRIEDQVDNLRKALDKYPLESIPDLKDRVDGLPELIERSMSMAAREPSKTKRKRLAFATVGCFAQMERIDYDSAVAIIETLDFLTETDIELLKRLGRCAVRVDMLVDDSIFRTLDQGGLERRLGQMIVSLSKLESRGLITETEPLNETFVSEGTRNSWINKWRERTYCRTPYGEMFYGLTSLE